MKWMEKLREYEKDQPIYAALLLGERKGEYIF
jgi:hypothetical protein